MGDAGQQYLPAFLDQLQVLAADGERLEQVSEEDYAAAYQGYHDQVGTFFDRWRPVLLVAAATAGMAVGGPAMLIGGPLVALAAAATVGSTSSFVALRLIARIESTLKGTLGVTQDNGDGVALRADSFRTLSDAVFANAPHNQITYEDSLQYSDSSVLKMFLTSIVDRATHASGISKREAIRLFAGMIADVLRTLDLSTEKHVENRVMSGRSIEASRVGAQIKFVLTQFEANYSGNISQGVCCNNGRVQIDLMLQTWTFPSLRSLQEAANIR